MFTGSDDIDRAAVHHAYGPANEVPGLPRRHTASDHGWSSDQVPSDLALLRACEAVLVETGQ